MYVKRPSATAGLIEIIYYEYMDKSSEEARVRQYGLWAGNMRKLGRPITSGYMTPPVVGKPWVSLVSPTKRLPDGSTIIESDVNAVAGQ